MVALLRQTLQLALRTAISKERKAFCQRTPSIEVLTFFFFCLDPFIDNKTFPVTVTGSFTPSAFCSLLSLPLCYLAHPFFFLCLSSMCSSSLCCYRWRSVWLPCSAWHISLVHPLTPQKAAGRSECARTASCPFLALNAEHMLSQLSSVAITIQPATSPPGPCLSADSCASAMARPTAAAGEVSSLWKALCLTHGNKFAVKKLNGLQGRGPSVLLSISLYPHLCWLRNIKLKSNLLLLLVLCQN